jgi:transcription antitermination factor NusG
MANPWYVLHLRPRSEKKVAEYCKLAGLSHYLPLRSQTRVYQRRRVTFEIPIFPGYLFVSFDRDGRLAVLKSNHVVRVLDIGNRRELLHQLAQVRKALRVDPGLVACSTIKCGRRVRIKGGPFMGVEGVVTEVKGVTEVTLNVDMVGQAVAVRVDRAYLEAAD